MDGNTDEKDVQEKFIGTLMEMMKGDDFPVYRRDDNDDGTVLQDLERQEPDIGTTTSITEPAVQHQNGHIPNSNVKNNDSNAGHRLRYDVQNVYAQMGPYPNDSVL